MRGGRESDTGGVVGSGEAGGVARGARSVEREEQPQGRRRRGGADRTRRLSLSLCLSQPPRLSLAGWAQVTITTQTAVWGSFRCLDGPLTRRRAARA